MLLWFIRDALKRLPARKMRVGIQDACRSDISYTIKIANSTATNNLDMLTRSHDLGSRALSHLQPTWGHFVSLSPLTFTCYLTPHRNRSIARDFASITSPCHLYSCTFHLPNTQITPISNTYMLR